MPSSGTLEVTTPTDPELDRPHRLVHSELFDQDWTGGETP
jgi:hypothetical protein